MSGCVFVLKRLNLLTVKLFGEIEFWFCFNQNFSHFRADRLVALWCLAISKHRVVRLQALVMFGRMVVCSLKGVSGFLAGFQIALFAFVGVELIGTMAAETKDPEKNLPKAVNAIPTRIILFYVLSLFVVMSVTPWNQIPCGSKPVRFNYFTCRYSNFSHHYELGGAFFSDVFNE